MLIYGLNDDDIEILSEIIRRNNYGEYKIIHDSMCCMKIEDILKETEIVVSKAYHAEEKVILFNAFEKEELFSAIDEVRSRMDNNIIFAAVTPTSEKWDFKELLDHLIQEREWFKKQH